MLSRVTHQRFPNITTICYSLQAARVVGLAVEQVEKYFGLGMVEKEFHIESVHRPSQSAPVFYEDYPAQIRDIIYDTCNVPQIAR